MVLKMEQNQLISKKEASMKQERQISDFLGWRRVSGSGARPNTPGDIESSDWLGECKTHVTANHKIHFDDKIWNKIADEAASKFKRPAYFVDDGSQRLSRTWVLFPMQDTPLDVMEYAYPDCKGSINFETAYMKQHILNTITGTKFTKLVYKVKLSNKFLMMADLDTFKEFI